MSGPLRQPGRNKILTGDDLIPKTTFAPLAYKNKLFSCQVDDVAILKQRPRLVAEDLLRIFLATKTPVTLWGPVGSRKTRTIEAFAQERDEAGTRYQVQTIQPSTEDPTTLHGLLFTEMDHTTQVTSTKRAIPQVAQNVFDYYQNFYGLTIQFMDEMTTCMPAVQNALLGLLTHGKYGDRDLSHYMTSVMAANPQGTVEVAYDLSTAVINRGGHIAWYGDVELFLDEWSDGFGLEQLKPKEEIVWFANTLVNQDRPYVFRDQYRGDADPLWTVDTLCPYDQMQFSERALTELMKMIDHINTIFELESDELRHHFIVEVTRAMVGPRWAKHAKVVCALESERLTPRKSIDAIRSNNITLDDTQEELFNKIGETLHFKGGRRLSTEQEETLVQLLLDEVVKDNVFSQTAYIAVWAFMSTTHNDYLYPLFINTMVTLVSIAVAQQRQDGMRWEPVPKFLPQVLKDLLVDTLKQRKDQEAPVLTNMSGGPIDTNHISAEAPDVADTLDTEFLESEIDKAE